MTSGGPAGTNGDETVTSGGRSGGRSALRVLVFVAIVAVIVGVINATSRLMEARGDGASIDLREPWAVEFTSIVFVIALAPFIGWMIGRFPPAPGRWVRFVLAHVAAATVFSAAHVAGMVVLRKLVYALAGKDYIFADQGGVVLPLLYEWRKDALTYAAIAAAYWAWRRWLDAPAPTLADSAGAAMGAGSERLEIRDGARVTMIEPADIVLVEAAGNYVEIHTLTQTHLARGTLAAFEQKLAGRGFVRIHRSRLMNRARMSGFRSTPSGDFEITLDNGRVVAGSRRFRAAIARQGG